MIKFNSFLILFFVVLSGCLLADVWIDLSWWVYAIVIVTFSSILMVGVFHLPWQFFVRVKYRGESQSESIAITFDDGPIPEKTERILDILKKHQVKATFFLIGNRIVKNPDIVKRIIEEGHLVGNHSYTHSTTFDFKSTFAMEEEMKMTDRVLVEHTGKKPRFFRPPYGVTNPNLARAIRRQNYVTLGWSIRSLDTILPGEMIFKRIKKVKGGDIILFHDFSEGSLSQLDSILVYIKSIGLKIVGLDTLIKEEAYVYK